MSNPKKFIDLDSERVGLFADGWHTHIPIAFPANAHVPDTSWIESMHIARDGKGWIGWSFESEELPEMTKSIYLTGGVEPPFIAGETVYIREQWNAELQSGEWWHELDLPEQDKLQLNWVVVYNSNTYALDSDELPPVWLPANTLPECFGALTAVVESVQPVRLEGDNPWHWKVKIRLVSNGDKLGW